MRSIVVPLDFLEAIGEEKPFVRIYWLKWLTNYTDELFRTDFCEFFQDEMSKKDCGLSLESIKTAYDIGIPFFKDGFTFVDGKKKTSQKPYSPEIKFLVEKVLDYLNQRAGTTYKPTKANSECISARASEGYTISDFIRVIDKKTAQWLNTGQQVYLRPITLFQAKKFENYLNEPEATIHDTAHSKPKSGISKLSSAADKAKRFFD